VKIVASFFIVVYDSLYLLYALIICRTIRFWLFAGQCRSIADQWELLYILGSKVLIFLRDEIDAYKSMNETTYENYG